jgi:2'-phosphotransferase
MCSKRLSYLLRHGIITYNLEIDSSGYVKISDILKLDNFNDITLSDIETIVKIDNKNRFSLIIKDGINYIRANQGHNYNINKLISPIELLEEITEPIVPCFHGTYQSCIDSIQKNGLSIMSRGYIHFTNDLHAKSGIRHDVNILVYINMKKAMENKIKFYKSENNVILSSGINGIIESQYFEKIENLI